VNETAEPYLSLVLACYNEEETLVESFAEIRTILDTLQRPYEVIFVDDVSRDRTRAILQELVARHPDLDLRVVLHEANQGRGATVGDGFRLARGTYTGYLDVDLETHPRYIPSLLRALEAGADVATVRRVYLLQLHSLDRFALSRGYAWLVQRLLRTRVQDTETGFKFFRRERLLALLDQVRDRHWFWDTEIMVLAERQALRIVEIPGAFVRRHDKTSTLHPLRDTLVYFRQLWRFRKRLQAL
jgi:glycosyltransferase AglD